MSIPSERKKEQIDHDFKRLAKGIRILMREADKEARQLIGDLLFDEATRLREDIEELFESGE